jgi:hypothetical protein
MCELKADRHVALTDCTGAEFGTVGLGRSRALNFDCDCRHRQPPTLRTRWGAIIKSELPSFLVLIVVQTRPAVRLWRVRERAFAFEEDFCQRD